MIPQEKMERRLIRRRLTVTEMARNFSEYINRVSYQGERFLLTRGSRVVAEIRPVPAARKLSELPELFAGLPRLTAEEAEALAEEWSSSRDGLGDPGAGTSWPY